MKKGDPVYVRVGRLDTSLINCLDWRRGIFLGIKGERILVGVGEHSSYQEIELEYHCVIKYVALSEEDATAKHAADLQLAFTNAQTALTALLPNETIQIKEGSIVAYDGAVTMDPVVNLTDRIGGVQETASWQVTVWKYHHATRTQQEEFVDSQIGRATNWYAAVILFIKTIFQLKANDFWANEALAQWSEEGQIG